MGECLTHNAVMRFVEKGLLKKGSNAIVLDKMNVTMNTLTRRQISSLSTGIQDQISKFGEGKDIYILIPVMMNSPNSPDNHMVSAVVKKNKVYFFDPNGPVAYSYQRHIKNILSVNYTFIDIMKEYGKSMNTVGHGHCSTLSLIYLLLMRDYSPAEAKKRLYQIGKNMSTKMIRECNQRISQLSSPL